MSQLLDTIDQNSNVNQLLPNTHSVSVRIFSGDTIVETINFSTIVQAAAKFDIDSDIFQKWIVLGCVDLQLQDSSIGQSKTYTLRPKTPKNLSQSVDIIEVNRYGAPIVDSLISGRYSSLTNAGDAIKSSIDPWSKIYKHMGYPLPFSFKVCKSTQIKSPGDDQYFWFEKHKTATPEKDDESNDTNQIQLKTNSAASEYIPPSTRPGVSITLAQAIEAIPFHKFQYNPQYADKDPYILISSGSFSPITILHVQLLTMVRDYIMVDTKIGHVLGALLSPVHDAYGKPSLIPQHHRVKMCQLATQDISWAGATTIETAQNNWIETRLIFDQLRMAISHVFNTVSIQQQQCIPSGEDELNCVTKKFHVHPRLVFCMGSDVLLGMRHRDWWSYEDVTEYCTTYRLAVLLREQDKENVEELMQTHPILSKYRANVWIIPPTYQNTISSTLIRRQRESGGSIHGLVHPNVEHYIYQNNLYQSPLFDKTQPDPAEVHYVQLFTNPPKFDSEPIIIATECSIPLNFSNHNLD